MRDGEWGRTFSDDINTFFTHFETGNNGTKAQILAIEEEQVLTLSTHDVEHVLQRVNPRKAAGPDGVPRLVLKDWTGRDWSSPTLMPPSLPLSTNAILLIEQIHRGRHLPGFSYCPDSPGEIGHILYVMILRIDYSSASNTVIPRKLTSKLS